MKILVLSPEKKDKTSRTRRRIIVRILERLDCQLLNPVPGRPPKDRAVNYNLFPQVFFKEQIKLMNQADLIIADLTDPDFKIGFLVSKAVKEKRPILGLFLDLKNKTALYVEYFKQKVKHPRKLERICLILGRKFRYCVKMETDRIFPFKKVHMKVSKALNYE